MEDKVTFVVETPGEKTINILAEESPDRHYSAQVVSPIISEGDPIGAVMFLSTDPNTRMGEVETNSQVAASFLENRWKNNKFSVKGILLKMNKYFAIFPLLCVFT